MTQEKPSIDLVEDWRQGDQAAANQLYGRYVERMMRVISHQLPTSVKTRVDAEDVVQSVFRTVFRRMREGEFHFRDDDDLWKLLVTIALNKTRNQTNRNLKTQKRDINREACLGDTTIDEALTDRLINQPNISDVLAFRETLDLLFAQFDQVDSRIIQLRLEGYTQEEIATQLDMTARTVRRRMSTIRDTVADLLKLEMDEPD